MLSKNRDIISYNHSVVINVSKFNINTIIFYFLAMLTDPEIFFVAFFPPSTRFNLGSGVAFSCHASLVSFNLDHFHSLPLSFTVLFLKNIT